MTTDAQIALAQVREALAAGPTPGPWSLKTVPTSDGSCHKIGPFPSASRVHSETHACVYAIGIRLGINDSTPVARELLANARLMTACSPANVAAILAHVEAQAAENERLTAECDDLRRAVRHEADCVEAAKAEIERLTAALQYEQHRADRQGTHGDGCADWGPEHYECAIRERDELRRQLAEAQKEIHNLNWALGTEGYEQMATPEEQAEHEKAVRAHHDVLARLEEGKRAYEAIKKDARRYRDWLRGGANIPPESTRWPRWEVRHWDGRHWNTLFAEQMDAAIDAAMGGSNAG